MRTTWPASLRALWSLASGVDAKFAEIDAVLQLKSGARGGCCRRGRQASATCLSVLTIAEAESVVSSLPRMAPAGAPSFGPPWRPRLAPSIGTHSRPGPGAP